MTHGGIPDLTNGQTVRYRVRAVNSSRREHAFQCRNGDHLPVAGRANRLDGDPGKHRPK